MNTILPKESRGRDRSKKEHSELKDISARQKNFLP